MQGSCTKQKFNSMNLFNSLCSFTPTASFKHRAGIKWAVLCTVVVCSLHSCTEPKVEQQPAKPNIILIISDDQAYSDYGFMGHEQISTPSIDKLASESLTFTRGYATAPLCSPSLASMITGLYAFQHGITGNDPLIEEYEGAKSYGRTAPEEDFPPNSYPVKRHAAYQTLSANFYKNRLLTETLSQNGYRSFQTGKWWVGSAEDAGFDAGMTHGDYRRGGRHGDEGLKIGREGLDPIYEFIEESDSLDQPYFIWYAPFLPHTPHTPPKDLEDKYLALAPSPTVAKYWAMVEWFDQTVGELVDHLKEVGHDENTIVIYTCDNGWIQTVDGRGYAPRSKRAPHEGGIRTPFMVKYPGKVVPKMDDEHVVSNVDIVPTIHGLLGLDATQLPGINVTDTKAVASRKTVFAECYEHDIRDIHAPTESLQYQIAVEKDWKLVVPNSSIITKEAETRNDNIQGVYFKDLQLFNLASDPEEKKNVAAENPDVVSRMSGTIEKWWQIGNQ